MTTQPQIKRISRYAFFGLAACLVLLLFSSTGGRAQNSDEPSPEAAKPQEIPNDQPTPILKVKLDEKAPVPGLFTKLNGVFEGAVNVMDKVFFYRIGSYQQSYVQSDHLEYYVRDRGTSNSFTKLDPNGVHEADSLSGKEAEALNARGLLVLGAPGKDGKPRVFRLGKIADREVEFVTVILDTTSKYVGVTSTNGTIVFHKELAPRKLLSQQKKDILEQAEVKKRAGLGRLKIDNDKQKKGDKTPYILTEQTGGAPVVVLWLALGSIFFTIYMRGVNIWGFRHAIQIVRGKYDNPNEPGEVTHFQALSSALSATVGLGNIAGVTIAMTTGGPGAFFWMLACGVFGMTSKFVECTLGQKYRHVKEDGTVLGGPMQYLHAGLKELGLGKVGFCLSIIFAVMCILASFGGGNMFQANQSGATMLGMVQKADINEMETLNADIKESAKAKDMKLFAELQEEKTTLQTKMSKNAVVLKVVFGLLLSVAVGIVILGGIKRIAAAAEKVVPTMCLIYLLACLWIIFHHVPEIPALVSRIFSEAFSGKAFGGGMVGVLIIGVQRAAFSNEAGVGSASIAHSAAKTEEPVREGAVALLGPFIDTVVVCSMTALVILITGAWQNEEWVVSQGLAGAQLTSKAFENEISWFPYVLAIAVVLFAYSTMISWSYYGERCWERLFGAGSTILYKLLYVAAVFVGVMVNLGAVLDFSDMMILSMAFPNIFGLLLLCPKVRADLLDYWNRYKSGEFKTYDWRNPPENDV